MVNKKYIRNSNGNSVSPLVFAREPAKKMLPPNTKELLPKKSEDLLAEQAYEVPKEAILQYLLEPEKESDQYQWLINLKSSNPIFEERFTALKYYIEDHNFKTVEAYKRHIRGEANRLADKFINALHETHDYFKEEKSRQRIQNLPSVKKMSRILKKRKNDALPI